MRASCMTATEWGMNDNYCRHLQVLGAEALVQWVNLPAWEVRDRALEPHSGIHVSMK